MNLPNQLSLLRVFLIPIFLMFLLIPYNLGTLHIYSYSISFNVFLSLIVFIFASITDWVDGHIARKYNLVTNLGKFLDPLADKLLMTAGLIVLVDMGMAPSWMVIIILSREFAVTGLRLIAALEGFVLAAGQSGKIKTTVQMITVIVLFLNFHPILNSLLLWATTLLTVYSGLEYFIQNKKVFQNKNA